MAAAAAFSDDPNGAVRLPRAFEDLEVVANAGQASFDRFARLASEFVRAPFALIWLGDGLSGDLKSAFGFPESWRGGETSSAALFCAEIGRAALPMVVGDALDDDRVAGLRVITDLNVRAYAGVPLRVQGDVVGTFCVLDDKPREWTSRELEILADLADAVAAEVELDRRREQLTISEERYRGLFEDASDLISTATLDGFLTSVNRSFEQTLGYPREQLIGMNLGDLLTEQASLRGNEHYERKQRGETATTYEVEMRASDGRLVELEASTQLVYEHGRIVGTKAICRDISHRKQAERALRESEERYALAIEGTSDGVWDWDLRTDAVYFAPRWKEMVGYRADELENHISTWKDLIHPEDRERALATTAAYRAGDITEYAMEFRLRHRDGSYRWILSRGLGVRDESGAMHRMLGSHVDITERKSTEADLARLLYTHELLLDAAEEGIVALDVDACITRANAAALAAFGYTSDQVLGRDVHELVHHSHADGSPYPRHDCRILLRVAAEGTHSDNDLFWRENGTSFPVRYTASPIEEDGVRTGMILVFEDLSSRAAAEAQLEMHRDIVARMDIGAYVFHLEDRDDAASLCLVEANAGSQAATGVEPAAVIGQRIGDVFPALIGTELPAAYRRIALGGAAVDLGDIHYSDDRITPSVFAVHAFPLPGRRVGVTLDNVTSQRDLELRLRQAQKMESVGRLAGGIAHDFNNLLTAIGGYSSLALERVSDDPLLQRDLDEVQHACERACSLTQQLLAFSRQQLLQPRPLDLNAVVDSSQRLLRRVIGEDVELTTRLAPILKTVKADRSQVEQVIVNLAVNARDAMQGGGTLRIETQNVSLDEEHGARLSCHAGDYVLVSVADDGCGMDEATREKLFEPFFTTKGVGEGTGLGLATVYGIVQQSGGGIAVETEVGVGTTFRIFLPAVDEPINDDTEVESEPLHGSEKVLLVEDEQVVRNLVQEILKRHGYEVTVCADPDEALARDDLSTFELLVTDVVMPRMSGRELAECLATVNPDLPVLYLSGYTSDVVIERGVLEDDVAFLQKPFTMSELGHKVRNVLDGTAR